MKKLILASLIVLSFQAAAAGGEGGNGGCNGGGNPNSPCQPDVGVADGEGFSNENINTFAPINNFEPTEIFTPTNVNSNSNINNSQGGAGGAGGTATAISEGGEGGAGGEGGMAVAGGGNASNSLTINDTRPSKVHYEIESRGKIKNTPQVTAPALATGGNEVCMGSTSVGGSGPGVGVSFGSTWTDENCNMRRNAAMLHNMGHAKTANVLMCADAKIAAAFAASGEFVCPPAPVQTVATSNVDYR